MLGALVAEGVRYIGVSMYTGNGEEDGGDRGVGGCGIDIRGTSGFRLM